MTTEQALFQLRCAAAEWLREHPDNPNAPSVKQALSQTNQPHWICSKCNGKMFVNPDGTANNAFDGSDRGPTIPCPTCNTPQARHRGWADEENT